MKIVHVSFAEIDEDDPVAWLSSVPYYTGILEAMSEHHEVYSIHRMPYSGKINYKNVNFCFFYPPITDLNFRDEINEFVLTLNPDVVVLHGWHKAWPIYRLCRALKNVKIFAQHHAERPLWFPKSFLHQLSDRFISGYFFSSKLFADDWLSAQQISDKRKVYEVMEVSSPFQMREKTISKTEIGIDQRSVTYLWVGRLDENKDLATLLKAFIPFLEKHEKVKLLIISHSGNVSAEIKKLLESNPRQISFVGKVDHDNMESWFNAADFIISTSHYESGGISVCEGMSCGCIPIVTNIPSFSTMTDHGSVGKLFLPGDSTALNSNLEESLLTSMDKEREKVLTQFRKNLSFQAIAGKMIEIFKRDQEV